ncbi:predicted protein [Nematostella vectensis]|uniref:Ion transport domain-containing protein n=1 Tax=Nematostella vectensis TaxID=45351 RepID=A7SLD2_NEMVE|nr:predicted protein [Nematostella vectensis]|eukprot:XP_001627598.1 predicted protein [Nematostella vectensis]
MVTWFERISMVIILVNCITLAMYDPLDKRCEKVRCNVLEKFEFFIFGFFLLEMVVKMVAMGVFGSHGYLQDTWNKLDFVIIVMGVIEKSLQGSDYLTIIRAFRVLRPLRAINKVPSIRILVTLLLDTLPMLGNVLLLSFLVFFVFGIIGVQLWQGKLRNRCFASTNDTALLLSFNQSVFYKPSFIQPDFVCSGPTNTGMTSCLSDIPHSYLHGRQCTLPPENLTSNSSNCADWNSLYRDCREDGPNPFWGTISFDNIAIAWMVIFQVITLEGWSDVMYLVQDTHSFWNWIYFIILIVIGAFFLVNLCLVVITMQFQETKAREIELMEENRRRQRYRSSRFSLSCLEKLRRTFCPGRCQGEPKEHIHHHHHHIYHHHHFHHHLYDCYTPSSPGLALSSDEDKFFGQDICQPDTLQIPEITIDEDEPLALATTDVAEPRPNPFLLDDDVDDSVFDFHQSDSYDVSRDMGVVHRFRAFCRRMAESRHFSRLIMIAILLNMICMGLEHHNQPQALTVTLEKTNIVFVTIFVLEMIINVISFGIMGYLSQLQNIFDGFVVVLSVTELLLENGYARLSVFRSIRLLRIFKLVRPVRYQLLVVIRTMTSVVTFFGLLFLFMFAFAILGMNLFGGEFYFPNAENISVPARTNFDSFLWAMVTVFQVRRGSCHGDDVPYEKKIIAMVTILTQENWNQVMFKGMRATSYWAALYFIALMTVGYYVLFNLLVAILVEGFTSSGVGIALNDQR